MAIPSSRAAFALALAAVSGCTLVVDTTGLVGGDAALETVVDGSTPDQRAPVGSDGATGIPPGSDASGGGDTGDAGGAVDSGPPCTVTCDDANATSSTCTGGACAYTCAPGWDDCNAEAGSNTDGCECATPMCCGSSCAATHSDGVGDTFYNCNAVGAPTQSAALAACAAYTGDPSACSGSWTCNGVSTVSVCYQLSDGGCGDYCWNYSGADNGVVTDCSCPGTKVGPWN